MSDYTDTTGALARAAGTSNPTVVLYAKLNLLDFVTTSTGLRLFRRGQAEKVRAILAERMARRRRKF